MQDWIYEADIKRLKEQMETTTDVRAIRKLRHYLDVAEWRLHQVRGDPATSRASS